MQKTKGCACCGGYLPKKRSRYCSDSCSYYNKIEQAKTKRESYALAAIKCLSCKTSFVPKTTRQRYCDNLCWLAEQKRRRSERRLLFAKEPKLRPAERFSPGWQSPAFGERKVTYAEFTTANSQERAELQSAVEDYLNKGGEITKYGDQVATLAVEGETQWNLPESEAKKIQAELTKIWGVDNVLGN